MVIGNLIMAVSAFLLYFGTRLIPDTMMWLRYIMYVVIYAVYVIGYTFQTSCTRSGQTVLTNDPNQRPLFTIFNLVASMLGMGAIQFLAPIFRAKFGDYTTADFFDVMIPIAVIISAILTLLAVIGIWEKDQPKYYGLGAETQKKVRISEYLAIMKENEPLRRLMVAGAGCKLALAIATNGTVPVSYTHLVQNRMLHDHTGEGVFTVRGTLQGAEELLRESHFVRCNHWYLVNLQHVSEIRKNIVIVAGDELEISRRNKTAFLSALTDYMGMGM